MNVNLSSIGMEEGQQYETILTSINCDGKKNAAPIGVICKGKDKIMCRIIKGSNTLDNIINQRKFVFNITLNPILFSLATIGNISEEYFTNDSSLAILKDGDAYLKCNVADIKEGIKHNDPIRKAEAGIIMADVESIVFNKSNNNYGPNGLSNVDNRYNDNNNNNNNNIYCVKAPNRGFYCLIESLVNFTRIDIVDKEKQDYFLDRYKESRRIINKVGSKEDKKAIDLLGETLKNKGYIIK